MLQALVDTLGENGSLAAGALGIGMAFGFLAQRSRFCLRSAVIEFARNVTVATLTPILPDPAKATGAAVIVAPGGGRVGMSLGELQQLYPERADLGPDKYDPQAQHLRVRPEQEGHGIIDFALGADGKVSAWRVGLPPQVDYVEGCG